MMLAQRKARNAVEWIGNDAAAYREIAQCQLQVARFDFLMNQAVTRCLGDVDVLPSATAPGAAADELLVIDSCLGLLLRLSRTP